MNAHQIIYAIFALMSLLVDYCQLCSSYYENCTYSKKNEALPELFWINLDRSKDRMEKMQRTLTVVNMPNRRVRGLDVKAGHIYLPPEIEKTWGGAW